MLKVYYLVLAVIIGLVGWLVADFARNSAEARDIMDNINNPAGNGANQIPPMPPQLAPFPTGNLDEIFKPSVETVVAPPAAATASTFHYIVTGTIIEPNGAIAFIVNPTKNDERICRVGDNVDDWEVVEIVHESVTFKDQNGNIMNVQVQKKWGGSKLERGGKVELPPEIANIPGAQDFAKRFSEGKETTEAVEQYIDIMAKTLPPAFIREFMKQTVGLADDDMPKDDASLGDFGKNLFRAIQGEQTKPIQGQSVENIAFTLRVNPDNSPIAPQSIFKSGDRRVYACFQNQGSLKGLPKVVTRWTNKTTREVIGFGPKPLNPNTAYNFIWWEKKEGWAIGEYEVELLSTQTFQKIGSGSFSIVQ